MNVIFTCGGTGGHINPAIALARLTLARRPESRVLFAGASDGMETTLVPREGFALETVEISSYQRKLTPKAILHNIGTLQNMRRAKRHAAGIIRDFKPDIVVGTGGYACYPFILGASKAGIPTLIHESNAAPGLTTRLLSKYVDRIMVSFEESRPAYKYPDKVVVTGTPVREDFIYMKKAEARKKLGLDGRPLVVSCWGSLGAREMNKKIARFIQLECENEPFNHIHATGSFGWRWMPGLMEEMGVELKAHPAVDMREYIYDMPTVMTAADVIICRAGASTISEVTAAAVPPIIVPSPNVAENHQEKNARVLEGRGAAIVMLERDCSGDALFRTVSDLLADEKRREDMSARLRELAVLDSAQRIYSLMTEMTKGR